MNRRFRFTYPADSVKFRVLLNLIMFTTIPFIIISVLIGFYLYNDFKTSYIHKVRESINQAAEPINHDFARYMDRSNIILSGPYYVPLLNNKDSINNIVVMSDFQRLFEATFTESDIYQYQFYLKNYTGLKGSFIEDLNDLDASEIAFVEEKVIKGNPTGFVWAPEWTIINNKAYITFYRNLVTLAAFKGALAVNIPLPSLNYYLSDLNMQKNVQIIMRKGSNYYWDGELFAENPLSGRRALLTQTELKDGSRLIAYVPKSIFDHRLLQIIGWMAACLLLLIVAVVYTSSVTANKITRSFNEFVSYLKTHDHSLDDNDIWKMSNRNDDVDVIKNRLINVLRKLNDSYSALSSSRTENIKLEMELLQARINPHLLYNTLSVIKWALLKQKDRLGAHTIDLMTSYYRIALNKGTGQIAVAKELKMIGLYVDIIRYTHSTNYQYDVQVDEDAMSRSIPLNLLQPIVENSLMHGLNGKGELGKLRIRGYIEENELVFTIADNGYGIAASKMDQLLKLEYHPEYGGYGIKNAIRRLNNLNGIPGGLTIDSELGQGTTVMIRIDLDRLTEREAV